MDSWTFHSQSLDDTHQLGLALGNSLAEGTVIGLNGTLGAGKTCLTQSLGSALGIADGNVVSPTFTICTPHEGRLILVHLDAYRINEDEEVDELGLDEMLDHGAVIVVEWAERIRALLPSLDVNVVITPHETTSRKFQFEANTAKGKTLLSDTSELLPQ